ncbi:GNAT family N-acetyltransferase [Aromatoleum sp.]|uniref:GNAT family N-acetyltransferase n=1 Tax=Aromatoleum sp. TaxID=2307007 RepID=UPI002FC63697
MALVIRPETPADCTAIERVTVAAFRNAPHTGHTERFIVGALRRAGQLAVSLVAQEGERIVGHVAVSAVTISSRETDWYGLGPISVLPECQDRGIGSRLIEAALAELRRLGAAGCVVLGDPGYYSRFGFVVHAGLVLPGVSSEYFQALSFRGRWPDGDVSYHEAFNAEE